MSRLLFDAFDSGAADVRPCRVRLMRDEAFVLFIETEDGLPPWRSHMIKRRQGDTLPAIRAIAYTESQLLDLTQFVSIAFRMVSGSTVVTGVATGDSQGNLVYSLGPTDTAVAGTYNAYFIATDAAGKQETLPTGDNLQVVVVPTI